MRSHDVCDVLYSSIGTVHFHSVLTKVKYFDAITYHLFRNMSNSSLGTYFFQFTKTDGDNFLFPVLYLSLANHDHFWDLRYTEWAYYHLIQEEPGWSNVLYRPLFFCYITSKLIDTTQNNFSLNDLSLTTWPSYHQADLFSLCLTRWSWHHHHDCLTFNISNFIPCPGESPKFFWSPNLPVWFF